MSLDSVESRIPEEKQFISKKVRVEERPTMGRYTVADDYIKTGEPIVTEQPYAACLLPEMFGTHCHHCFHRLEAAYGCADCSNVAFCSPGCRDTAVKTYHKFECKYLDLLIGSGMSILTHTALRMVTQNSLAECLGIYQNRSKEKVYSLCTNAEKRSGEDFLQRTLMAAFLLKCLERSGYFGENRKDKDGDLTEEELRVCELLLFHLQILQFNAHEIFETRRSKEHQFKGSKFIYIGVGIYPTASLLNHDCQPAVTRHFVGKSIVLKTSRPLAPNEMVAENYGPIFSRKPIQQRQRSLLSRYWFKCECLACTYNWPMINAGLESFTKCVRCPSDHCTYYFTLPLSKPEATCPKCEKNVSLTESLEKLKWCEKQYEFGFKTMEDKRVEAIEIIRKAIDVFYRISRPPHQGTSLAHEYLQLCEASFGNVWVVSSTEQKPTFQSRHQ
ncbi:unnamed protein product [Acanthoscelides obtectus]|uniref:SET and MYND domain-containing protein 4 n=1 Tax=Acanthoscelides obtectus TaxID=200917 RepID=A0A9P0K0M7_ACAOB|nr:unnamed protein product [Acanthoscelides obtectus]CAK1669908.1 SET and MYND domain-containing protein 4 [Acanthoscelides obtectus]